MSLFHFVNFVSFRRCDINFTEVQSMFFLQKQSSEQIEPPRDKTNKITVRPAKTQISLGIHPVWSVFAVCSVSS